MTIRTEATFIYLVFCPLGDGTMFVKIGISALPMDRFVSIHSASPVAVSRARFVCAGNQRTARKAESDLLKQYREHTTRGEWIRVPVTRTVVRGLIRDTTLAVMKRYGRLMPWTVVRSGKILEHLAVRYRGKLAA